MTARPFEGKGVVVTGGGSGIGQALAERLSAEGARVVVNDLDAAAAERVAASVGGVAFAGDASSADGARALVEAATASLERIDVFVANAGIGSGHEGDSLQAPDEAWERSLAVNALAHVRAARLLVPGWLADGRGGRFVVTASAAGLLTMLGGAPYAVSKHAAVAFAEWLSVTYGDRGIDVHAICPQAVRTPMLTGAGRRADVAAGDGVLEPSAVAEALVEAVAAGRFFVLPHPEVARHYAARAADPDRWLAAMRRLQAALPAPS
jgi:NAD(P)-dependent dehydrogenase (short-subunit alcohol dehydrogenase family)